MALFYNQNHCKNEQAHSEDQQDDREFFQGASQVNKRVGLPFEFLRKKLLCLSYAYKLLHPLLKLFRLVCSVLSNPSLKSSLGKAAFGMFVRVKS